MDFHALDAVRGALLEGGGVRLVRDGGDGADVFVGGEGGKHVLAVAGEQIDHAAGQVAGGEHFT